ncbi:transposable element Tcb1 transposase [Trichonephila clavipes]|nr:transposable element Tcb1 transposase [Trichonephila clavipes]
MFRHDFKDVSRQKVSNHGSIPITIDSKVVAFIVFEEGFHQPIKRTKQQIGSRDGQNQTAVMRICDRCMQEDTTDRPGRGIHLSAALHQSGVSARRPLLGVHLTQNERRLLRQWCDERGMWKAGWKEVAFTDDSRICLQHKDARIRVWRHCGERIMNSHETPATLVLQWVLWYGEGIGYHTRTLIVRIGGILSSHRYIS